MSLKMHLIFAWALTSWVQFATSPGGLDGSRKSQGVFKDSFTNAIK